MKVGIREMLPQHKTLWRNRPTKRMRLGFAIIQQLPSLDIGLLH